MDDHTRTARVGAWMVLVGALLSGPVAMLIVEWWHPQPAWIDAATFAAHLHPVQRLPFLLGFVLVGGLVTLVVGVAGLHDRPASRVAVVLAAVFAALVFLNYVLQTTVVPAMADPFVPAHEILLGWLSMSQPRSLGWALEMWGYGVVGVATWLLAPAFAGDRLEAWTARAYLGNGVLSVAGAVWTMATPGWVMSVPGLVAYAAWNGLVVVLAAMTLVALRRRARRAIRSESTW
jgi:hypothetical protein